MSVFDFFTTQAKYGLTVGLRMSSWSGKTSSDIGKEREEEESSTGEYELEIEAITYSLRRPSKLILYLQKLKQLSGLDIRVCLAYAAEYYIFLLLSLPSYSHLDLSFYFKRNSWSEVVHSKLICIMTNMIYRSLELDGSIKATSSASSFLIEQVDLIGGVEFILYKYSLATTREERRNLYSVLFDYVLHQINEACAAAGLSEYTDDEIQPLAVRLALADAPEAFYISVKLGVEGIGKILRRSIAASLSGFSNSERLNQLLANITEKFDTIVASFTHLDKEFLHLRQITKSSKYMETIQELRNDISMSVNLAWATLHSLLHSERATNRQNGYI
ncbi:BnaC08g08400D [Brassica napus]|uniref:BnaC08g08400D protein n=1 Tax=Brassica napus TaxID=3708 RepID=A0A078FD99_BRANA|nr:BnaC08g08400D [Brassica napus]